MLISLLLHRTRQGNEPHSKRFVSYIAFLFFNGPFFFLVGFSVQLPLNSAVQAAFGIRLKATTIRQHLDTTVVSVRQPLPCSASIKCGKGAMPPSAKSQLLNSKETSLDFGLVSLPSRLGHIAPCDCMYTIKEYSVQALNRTFASKITPMPTRGAQENNQLVFVQPSVTPPSPPSLSMPLL